MNLKKQLRNWRTLGGLFDLENKEARIAELEDAMLHPDFWNDQQAAQTVISEANGLKEQVNEFNELNDSLENLELTYELVKEENDAELRAELEDELLQLTGRLNQFELQLLL